METIRDYIKKLEFDYLKTFSFQRGKLQLDFMASIEKEISELKSQLKTPYLGHFSRERRLSELEKYVNQIQYLTNDKKEIHPTSVEISILQREDELVEALLETVLKGYIVVKAFKDCTFELSNKTHNQ